MATAQPKVAPQQMQGLDPAQLAKMKVMAKQAMGLLLEDQHVDLLLKQARAGDPSTVVATMVLGVMRQIYEAGSQAGQLSQDPKDMVAMMATAIQIIGNLTEILVSDGVVPEDQAAQFVAATSKKAVDMQNQGAQQGGAPQGGPPPVGAAPPGGEVQQPSQGAPA